MARKQSERRRRMWERNPHCFWCGIETVLVCGTRLPPNAATIDHIRSRFSSERIERADDRWSRGIWVLACNKCNHDRGAAEQAFLAAFAPEVLHAKSKSPKAPPSLTRAQARLCAAVLAFLRGGGSLYADTFKQHQMKSSVLGCADNLRREYETAGLERKRIRA